MNSSPDSSSSLDEIVFVPLTIDESASPRLRSSRRKPKHPQKLTPSPPQPPPPRPPLTKRPHPLASVPALGPRFDHQSSFDESGGSDGSGDLSNLYFGESHPFLEKAAMICQVDEAEDNDEGVVTEDDAQDSTPAVPSLSYDDLRADMSSSDESAISMTSRSDQIETTEGKDRDLFVPAPNGGGYYILTTTSPPSKPVRTAADTKDDAGFSIYDNQPLNDDDDDTDDDRNDDDEPAPVILPTKRISANSATSAILRPSAKLKILTMEMRPERNEGGKSRFSTALLRHGTRLVETTVGFSAGDDDDDDDDVPSPRKAALLLVKSEPVEESVPDALGGYNYVTCDECDRVFDTEARFRRHYKLVHGPKAFSCPECSKCFTQYGHMQVHLRTVHTTAKPFECEVCHRKFNVSSNRNRHQKLHYTKGSLHFIPNGASLVYRGDHKPTDDVVVPKVERMEA